jgi:hypothetical protein
MTPSWSERKAESKCVHCAKVYSVPLSGDYRRLYLESPLWFRADFRDEGFWVLNGEHLDHLKRAFSATLRDERLPVPSNAPTETSAPR